MREHKTLNLCDEVLKRHQAEGSAVSNGRAQDGDRWRCPCGRVFVHVCDEAEGCSWVEG